MADYRIEELANVTGTTVRTLQSYRNKGLLAPPRREGRVALYSDEHVTRLALIADLIGRGYSLNAVAELLDGLGRGERIQDLLGLDETIDEAGDEPAAEPAAARTITPREVRTELGLGDRELEGAVALGVVRPADGPAGEAGDPDERAYRIDQPRLFDVGLALLRVGVPWEAILENGAQLQADAEVIARRFVRLVLGHVIRDGALVDEQAASSVTALVQDLVPHASLVVAEQVDVALRALIHQEIEATLRQLMGAAAQPLDAPAT